MVLAMAEHALSMDKPRKKTREILDQQESDLLADLTALQAQLECLQEEVEQVKTEIANVRRAKGAIGPTEEERASWDAAHKQTVDEIRRKFDMYREIGERLRIEPASELKIKDLIAKVFVDHFPDGATPAEIGEQIQTSYRRKVDPGSVRPNLARLREDGIIKQGIGTRWMAVPEAATAVLYHYKGVGEDDGYILALATAFVWKDGPDPEGSGPANTG
jgi:hypothetical protein